MLVDGFERDLDEINIEDIESFTVLKDASTTAIYGSRGANGVVLILLNVVRKVRSKSMLRWKVLIIRAPSHPNLRMAIVMLC